MGYAWFFWTAFVAALLWLLALGWRERLSPWRWAVLVLAAVLLGLVGSKLGAAEPRLWIDALRTRRLPVVWDKSWFGGLALAAFGLLYLRRKLGLPKRALDLLVAPAFVAMALGRVGCLEGGCCLGTPTSLPWAFHVVDGVGVHPIPVYEMVFALSLVAILSRLRHPPGRRFSLALLLYFGFRFVEGFLRPGETVLVGLKAQQLAALVLLGFWLWYTAAETRRSDATPPEAWQHPGSALVGLTGFALLFAVTLASPLERLVLWTAFALVLGASAAWIALNRSLAAGVWRRWALGLGLLALVLSLGTRFPAGADSLGQAESLWRVGFGGDLARYEETCGGMHDVQLGAVRVERVLREPSGVEGRAGVQVYTGVDESSYERSRFFVVNPYAALDSRWIGVAGGVHLGDLVVDGDRRTKPLPAFELRLGPRDLLFVYAGVGETFPGGAPVPSFRMGLGFGLGNLGRFRFGVGFTGWYAEPRFRLPSGVEILARGAMSERTHEFGVGVSVPFARKTR
ncbi:MAG: hypothetical protein GXO73_08070 [Calditrichaeota bacterium]|nr:hypothetical protein [Calditrichota bacterium]